MSSLEVSLEERLKRFLYTNNYHGVYITGNPDKHFCKLANTLLFQWIRTNHKTFIEILSSASKDPLLTRRANLFYLLAEALQEDLPDEIKIDLKKAVFDLHETDEEFFDFIKYYTLKRKDKSKISSSLRRMIVKFYRSKFDPLELAKTVTKQDGYHSWTHKDLIKLSHIKCPNALSDPIYKYVLFGMTQLPDTYPDSFKSAIELIKKTHEVRTSVDVPKVVALMKELHVKVEQVNSKLNKNEEVWLAALPEMTTREVLQNLYRFYKLGFFKSGSHSQFQTKVIEALTNTDKVKSSKLHPVEVFIYLKIFEKGGKPVDPKLLVYLQHKEVKEEVLKRVATPIEPKCKPILQNINKCLILSYNNVQPTGKRFMVTIDVTEKADVTCFHNKRITCFEAVHTIVRFLSKVEKNVTVAVFKNDQINFVDLSKSHSAIEKLQEHKAEYIIPSAPIEWAKNKKKQIDVFINFMSCDWLAAVPKEVKDKMEKLPEALSKYCKKMKSPDTRLVKVFLAGTSASFSDPSRNILTIAGFSVEVPRVLEAFCRGQFC